MHTRWLPSCALAGVFLACGPLAAQGPKSLRAAGKKGDSPPKARGQSPFFPAALTPESFDRLHKMIKPQPGESRFLEIPWILSLWEGRQKAAREGKPMLVWAGGWGVPIGTC